MWTGLTPTQTPRLASPRPGLHDLTPTNDAWLHVKATFPSAWADGMGIPLLGYRLSAALATPGIWWALRRTA